MSKNLTKRMIAKELSRVTGLGTHKSRAVVFIVFDILRRSISEGKETYVPNVGTLSVCNAPKTRNYWRLGKIVKQYKNKKRIRFKPDRIWK